MPSYGRQKNITALLPSETSHLDGTRQLQRCCGAPPRYNTATDEKVRCATSAADKEAPPLAFIGSSGFVARPEMRIDTVVVRATRGRLRRRPSHGHYAVPPKATGGHSRRRPQLVAPWSGADIILDLSQPRARLAESSTTACSSLDHRRPLVALPSTSGSIDDLR
jgi:hypothetical protein